MILDDILGKDFIWSCFVCSLLFITMFFQIKNTKRKEYKETDRIEEEQEREGKDQ